MLRAKIIAAQIFWMATAVTAADFSGASAFKYTQAAVNFGPRPSGSAANRQLQGKFLAKTGVPSPNLGSKP